MGRALARLGVALVVVLACGGAAGAALQRVVGGYTAISAAMSGMWVAKEAGLFEKHGLNVSLVYMAAGTKMAAAMIAGDVHMAAIGGTGVVMAGLKGADLVLIASTVNRSPFVVMAQPAIRRPADLKGRVIGMVRRGSSGDFSIRAALRLWGLDPERDVRHVQTGGLPETLAAMKIGTVDAAPMTHPTATHARKAGLRELADLSELPIEYVHTGVGATRRFLAEHAGEAKAFLKAYVEGLYHFRANREFGVRTIGRYARTGDQEVLAEAYERYGLRYMEIPPHIHRRSIQGILEQLTGTFPEARAADPERFRDARFMEELEREGFFKALERSYRR